MPINDVMLRIPMADSEASDMDFWKTDPAKVEVKRAAKKRSAAKSKAAVPVSGRPAFTCSGCIRPSQWKRG